MVGRERRNRIVIAVKDQVLKTWLNASYYAPSIPSRRFIHKSYYLLLLVTTIGLGLRQSLFVLHIKAATRALRNNNHYQLIDGERKVFENENEKKETKQIDMTTTVTMKGKNKEREREREWERERERESESESAGRRTLGLRSDPCCMSVPMVNQKLFAREKSLLLANMTAGSLLVARMSRWLCGWWWCWCSWIKSAVARPPPTPPPLSQRLSCCCCWK